MTALLPLFDLRPTIDRMSAAGAYVRDRRVQIRELLTDESAAAVHRVLADETPWGLAWKGAGPPRALRREALRGFEPTERAAIGEEVAAAMRGEDYAFLYGHYPMLDAYLQGWGESEGLALLLEHINSEPFLALAREVTGLSGLIKADAQATLYAPGHFLALHDDSHVAEGWRVAYVLNFCREEWRPEWGGCLLFHDGEGDVVGGWRPRFNSLNLFAVPQRHSVSYVPPFAPAGRFAISGWFRER